MPKAKDKTKLVEEPIAEQVVEPIVGVKEELQSMGIVVPVIAKNKAVRVINQGAPFACDLTSFGYGMRWPTKAIYTITMTKYTELLEQGFNGQTV